MLIAARSDRPRPPAPYPLRKGAACANLDYGLRTLANEVANASGKEKLAVQCTIAGWPAAYEAPTVVHTVKRRGEVTVIDHVATEVCDVGGHPPADRLAPEIVRRIEALLTATPPPLRTVPLYELP